MTPPVNATVSSLLLWMASTLTGSDGRHRAVSFQLAPLTETIAVIWSA
jgi:hypothetical protein